MNKAFFKSQVNFDQTFEKLSTTIILYIHIINTDFLPMGVAVHRLPSVWSHYHMLPLHAISHIMHLPWLTVPTSRDDGFLPYALLWLEFFYHTWCMQNRLTSHRGGSQVHEITASLSLLNILCICCYKWDDYVVYKEWLFTLFFCAHGMKPEHTCTEIRMKQKLIISCDTSGNQVVQPESDVLTRRKC
jgi:hypothetical protein